MWRPLLPTLLLLHASTATLFSEGGRLELQGHDGEDDLYDPEQLAAFIEELSKAAEHEREQEAKQQGFVDTGARDDEVEIELGKEAAELPLKVNKGFHRSGGQSEFVGYVEPKAPAQLKHVEQLEKRVSADAPRADAIPLVHTGNLVFIAVATVCVVAAVVGVVGGAFYFHTVRSQQLAAERSDFTHYAPAGPGKEKKKKKGDEALAYKAQLHHYQQTKQKIISGEEQGAGIPEPDEASEASDDDGNNFSVYECPGLAPTGDIEVQNPNFDSRP